jgi:flagellar biosynthesis/type III secretory pathway M-ring protein FliF/YscJ
MAKRRKRKRARVNWLMIVALALLIAGFLARRMMMPRAARYLAHYSHDYPAAQPPDDSNPEAAQAAHSNDDSSGEHLSDSDRRALDEVIRRKTAGH